MWRMTLTQYIAAVTTAYAGLFAFIFVYVGEAPAIPVYEVIALTIIGSVFLSVMGTLKMLQFVKPDEPRFLLPTIVHGLSLIVMLTLVFTT